MSDHYCIPRGKTYVFYFSPMVKVDFFAKGVVTECPINTSLYCVHEQTQTLK